MTKHRFNINIPLTTWNRIQAERQRLGVSANAICLVALDKYLTERENEPHQNQQQMDSQRKPHQEH